MKLKTLIGILIITVSLAACNEEDSSATSEATLNTTDEDGVTVTEIDTTSATSTVLTDYDQSSFSKYVYWHKTEDKILIDYDFFPSGSDFDSQTKKATLPCEFGEDDQDTAVNVNVSAPTDPGECENIEIDLSAATFTIDGVEFAFSATLEIFADDFEFKISSGGFTDSVTGTALSVSADNATLETVASAAADAV